MGEVLGLIFIVVVGGFCGGWTLAFAIVMIVKYADEELSRKLEKKEGRLMIPCCIISGIIVFIVNVKYL